MAAKLTPQGVFAVVGLLPKEMQEEFKKATYTEVRPEGSETDFIPDPELRYDNSLGLSWLTTKGIPNTVEGLEEQREYIFKTMISGPVRYNVGQFIVLFPDAVYSSSDIEDNIVIAEVLDELEFPPEVDIIAKSGDQVIDPNTRFGTTALQAALLAYVPQGKIKLHVAGIRMYHMGKKYSFEDKYPVKEAEQLSFREQARRQRNN